MALPKAGLSLHIKMDSEGWEPSVRHRRPDELGSWTKSPDAQETAASSPKACANSHEGRGSDTCSPRNSAVRGRAHHLWPRRQCTCDYGKVCNQKSRRCLSVLLLPVLPQDTSKWWAHRNQRRPTSSPSQRVWYRQILTHVLTPLPFIMSTRWTKSAHRRPGRPEEHRRGR